MNQNMRNQIVRTGVKSVQALAKKYPDMKVGFNIQIGKIDIAVLFGLTEEVEEELEEEVEDEAVRSGSSDRSNTGKA